MRCCLKIAPLWPICSPSWIRRSMAMEPGLCDSWGRMGNCKSIGKSCWGWREKGNGQVDNEAAVWIFQQRVPSFQQQLLRIAPKIKEVSSRHACAGRRGRLLLHSWSRKIRRRCRRVWCSFPCPCSTATQGLLGISPSIGKSSGSTIPAACEQANKTRECQFCCCFGCAGAPLSRRGEVRCSGTAGIHLGV